MGASADRRENVNANNQEEILLIPLKNYKITITTYQFIVTYLLA